MVNWSSKPGKPGYSGKEGIKVKTKSTWPNCSLRVSEVREAQMKKEKKILKNECISHKNIFKYHRMKPTTWLRVISIVSHCTMDSTRQWESGKRKHQN